MTIDSDATVPTRTGVTASSQAAEPIPLRSIFQTWWPLAASWLLMSIELPMVSAVLARLAEPRISLAAYGGVVFPISMVIESPIIMLLAASTTLSRDWASYLLVRRFMAGAALVLTAIHAAVAFTPLFDVVVGRWIGAPEEIQPAARIGLQIMTPWTASIAYRRFQHGVLIRFGRSRVVGSGTVIRIVMNAVTLAIGVSIGGVPGIVVGTAGVAVGVLLEAIYIGWRVRPVIRGPLRQVPPVSTPLTSRAFLEFYVPLALTSFLLLAAMPIGSAGMSRMPRPLDSLATWPVLNGLFFLFRGIGIAFNEVVVARAEEAGAIVALRRFSWTMSLIMTTVFLLLAATPASRVWFETISGLSPQLSDLGRSAIWIGTLLPGLAFIQSFHTGLLVHGRVTRAVTESVLFSLATSVVVIIVGAFLGTIPGVYVALLGVVLGTLAQVGWLMRRSRPILLNALAR